MLPVTLPSFNPRTRVGCDTSPATIRCRSSAFQSTHPRGVRPRPALRPGAMSCFNPRTRVGCDDGTAWEIGFAYAFQSTHPRGVRHCGKLLARGWIVVSIHALAWGATAGAGAGLQHPAVSIHAPAWGATSGARPASAAIIGFNPRTRVGCDLFPDERLSPVQSFNPRTRVGCDGRDNPLAAGL